MPARFASVFQVTGRLRRAFRAISDIGSRQQITRTGLVFSLAATLVGFAAFASANNLLFLILAAMLGTLLISGLVSRLTIAGLELELDLPEYIVAGRALRGRVSVANTKRWMPSFSVHVVAQGDGSLREPLYFPVITGGGRGAMAVEMLFPKRGAYLDSRFLFSTRFPFGFAERRIPVHLRREFLVYPSLDGRPECQAILDRIGAELEARTRGMGSDFYRIRPYEAMESARHVDWRATAHTGDLQVREFARQDEAEVEIYLDLDAGGERREWFEGAVRDSAFLAWSLAERGARVRLRTADFDCAAPREGSVHRLLKYLALVEPMAGRAMPEAGDDSAPVARVVFTPEIEPRV